MAFFPDLRNYLLSKALLTDYVDRDIYAGIAPTSVKIPYIIFNQTNREPFRHFGGAANIVEETIEFKIWASKASLCDQIGEALRNVLDGYRGFMGQSDIRFTRFDAAFNESDIEEQTASQRKIVRRDLEFVFTRVEAVPTLP